MRITEVDRETHLELDSVERFADNMFGKPIDVEFTRLLDRVNDERNVKPIQ